MNWPKAIAIWLLIFVKSIHGTSRQLLLAPLLGDLPSRQLGVLVGSAIVFVIAGASVRWIGARSFAEQFRVGLLWVALIVIFEVSLRRTPGYSLERILTDYNLPEGGFMGLGLLFILFAPSLAARVHGFGRNRAASRTRKHLFRLPSYPSLTPSSNCSSYSRLIGFYICNFVFFTNPPLADTSIKKLLLRTSRNISSDIIAAPQHFLA